jgi:hypothetical protein
VEAVRRRIEAGTVNELDRLGRTDVADYVRAVHRGTAD